MGLHDLLIDTFYFLITTLALVPLFKLLKLGSSLGYIISGIIIGPMCLNLINNSNGIVQVAELGITLLLFMVGLELSPARLKKLRKSIFTEGTLQMGITTIAFSLIGVAIGLSYTQAIVIAIALSLSSTAFALSHMNDTSQLTLSHGQSSLSILLFQDLLIVPLLAILPLLSGDTGFQSPIAFSDSLLKLAIFTALISFCFFLLPPAISFIKKRKDPEMSLAAFLLLIIGMAVGMENAGLSMPMGAFITGLFLANSEVKTNIKGLTLPFKGILMGLFFMTLGIELDFNFLSTNALAVGLISFSIIALKSTVLMIISRFRNGNYKSGFKVSLLISQAGEFGIVVLASAMKLSIVTLGLGQLLVTSILMTMIISPFLANLPQLQKLFVTKENIEKGPEDIHDDNVIDFPKIDEQDKKAA